MEKSDLKEIRKALKARESCISWVYGLYVDPDNLPVWENVMRLADMEEAERFRHISLFARTLSPGVGKDTFPAMLDEEQSSLLSLRSAKGVDIAEFEEFRDTLLSGFSHTDPYYAALARVIYDVPTKSGDGRRLEDGDVVYEALLFSICPATLSKPMLGFDSDRVTELNRRWQIGNPVTGFLYPAFSDRAEDRHEVLIQSKTPENEEYVRGFFRISETDQPIGMKTQKDIFASLLDRMDVSLQHAAAISENVAEKAAEEDVTVLEKEDIRKIAEAAGVDSGDFDEIYDDTVGDVRLAASAVADSYVTVKTDSVVLKVPSDKAQLIETRKINGRDYILIPADGTVTVNGAAVTALAKNEEEAE